MYITAVTEACGANAFHAWSIHPYRRYGEREYTPVIVVCIDPVPPCIHASAAPESAIPDLAGLTDFVAQAGAPTLPGPLPVLSSEWGYTSASPAGCDPSQNAVVTAMDQGERFSGGRLLCFPLNHSPRTHCTAGKYLARMFLTSSLIGAPFFIW